MNFAPVQRVAAARRRVRSRLRLCSLEERLTPAFSEFVDPNPNPGNQFGALALPLSTGNVVVTSPFDDFGGTDAGAVYLFNGATGALISTLRGSSANDRIGSGGATAVGNGNFVILSPLWDNGIEVDAGAATWGDGETGISGVVSAANSLVGGTASGSVGSFGVQLLTNGNYVVRSPNWDNGAATSAGAATWGDGEAGVIGVVSAANSLIGSSTGDSISLGIQPLTNGNYVVRSQYWDDGVTTNVGAVTWGDGSKGIAGAVSAANSLIGSTADDQVGGNGVTALSNGNYLVASPQWNNGPAVDAGAVTWANGTTGLTGVVNATNSLVGGTTSDAVGNGSVRLLTNGNYLIHSATWDNGIAVNAGAITWGNSAGGVAGLITAANSLVGGSTEDRIGSTGILLLTNGNYVARSADWDNGAAIDAGAITWGNGATGVVGLVSAGNSLVGGASSDSVGSGPIVELANGHYVTRSPLWDNGAIVNAGAVTWGNGTIGGVGLVSAGNSLVGGASSDSVGSAGVAVLPNGHYVAFSHVWDNGAIADAGAATWCDGAVGATGLISAANSLVGSSPNDRVGIGGATVLSNGNYVISSQYWINGAATSAGAATWASGATGIVGVITVANSLIGSSTSDNVGASITALTNGHYVVSCTTWDNGAVADVGAATWGNGLTGTIGVVSAANSLVGLATNDAVSSFGVTPLTNGNYVVRSPAWDNGAAVNAGAVTWGDGSKGTVGTVGPANSLVGSTTGDLVGDTVISELANSNYLVRTPSWDNGAASNAGAVTWGSGTSGVSGVISATKSLVGSTLGDSVGSVVLVLQTGDYLANSPGWDNGALSAAGAVTWGSGAAGVVGAVSASNSMVGLTANTNLAFPTVDPFHGTYYSRFVTEGGGRVRVGSQTRGLTAGGLSGRLASGKLEVFDAVGAVNSMTLHFDGANYVVTDATEQFWAIPTGATLSNANKTMTIPTAVLASGVVIDAQGGSDTLTVNWATAVLDRDVAFLGGTGVSDEMVITGGTFSIVVVSYSNKTDGVILMDPTGPDPARYITYTGLEPVDMTGTTVDDLVFNLPSGVNSITLGDDSAASNGKSRLSGGTIETTDFSNPTNSLTINRGSAADTLTLTALPDFNRTLTLGAATAPFAPITFTGGLSIIGGHSLTAFSSSSINFSSSASDVFVGGSGSASLTTSQNVLFAFDSSLTTQDGDITILANQQPSPTAGAFVGIDVNGGLVNVAGAGALTMKGRGGDSGLNYGVRVEGGGSIRGGTSKPAIVEGVSGPSSGRSGVLVRTAGSSITSKGADIIVVGQGGGTGAAAASVGVLVETSGTISGGATGTVTVTGTGGAGAGGNFGVYVHSVGASIKTTGAKIVINGTGGGTGASNQGVQIANGGFVSTVGAGGTIEVFGQGSPSATGSTNYGVYVNTSSAKINAPNANVSIIGVGGGTGGASGGNYGVYANATGSMSAGGTLTIHGTGGNSTGTNNYGAVVGSGSSWVGTAGVSVTAVEGTGTAPFGIVVQLSSSVSSGSGNIALIADTTSIDASSTVTCSNVATLRQRTIGRPINLGGVDVVGGNLGLTDAELDRVLASQIQIGNADAGPITVSSAINRAASTAMTLNTGASIGFNAGINTLAGGITLNSAGPITQAVGKIETTGTLLVNAAGGETATFNAIGNVAGLLAIPAGVTTLVNGSFLPSGAVQVNGTLGGSGLVGTVTVLGTGELAPGVSPGKLFTGNVVLNTGSILSVELDGASPGTGYDQLAVAGTVDLGDATLNLSVGYTPANGQVFTIIDNDATLDPIGNTFDGLAEGDFISAGGFDFVISYKGGDGNDVTLTRFAAPTASVTIDSGTGQRSMIQSLTVTFSEAVNFVTTAAAAFQLDRLASSSIATPNGPVILDVSPTSGPASSFTITFNDPTFAPLIGVAESLIDGLYTLTLVSGQIKSAATGLFLDGDGNGLAGGNHETGFHRLFGDVNGDGFTDNVDLIAYRAANGSDSTMMSFDPAFDVNGDGFIDNVDFIAFRARLGVVP